MKDRILLLEILTAERNYGEAKILFKNKNCLLANHGIPRIPNTTFTINKISKNPEIKSKLLTILESEE